LVAHGSPFLDLGRLLPADRIRFCSLAYTTMPDLGARMTHFFNWDFETVQAGLLQVEGGL